MLIVTVFKTDRETTVRTTPFTPSMPKFPELLFAKPKEIVQDKSFKKYVVEFLLQKFNQELRNIHSVVIVHNDDVLCRWRGSRGHFKEI